MIDIANGLMVNLCYHNQRKRARSWISTIISMRNRRKCFP